MISSRRDFLAQAAGCAGYLAAGLGLAGSAVRQAFAARQYGTVVAETDFARVEQLGEGVWGVVSTPLRDGERHFATVSNGGIVAGRDGVLLIEGFMSDAGSAWVRAQAMALTGKEPTHVVVTHFHADHCRGLPSLVGDSGAITMATPTTRDLMSDGDEPLVPETALGDATTRIDLGGRSVTLVPRLGHTPSDVTVHLDDPAVIWCGDLVWNAMFPNFTHSIPSHMIRHCEEILGRPGITYVPGHGDVDDAAGLNTYLGLLREVESGARRALQAGIPVEEAAADFALPESLGEWLRFSPDYYERAFRAWERELGESAAH